MNRPLANFSVTNPTGQKAGMEPVVNVDLLRAAVENSPPAAPTPVAVTEPEPQPMPPSPATFRAISLVNKNIRLPADLVEFIDYTFTRLMRMKKQDAYTEALETYFRPLMAEYAKGNWPPKMSF